MTRYVVSLWLLSAAVPLGMMVGGASPTSWLWFFTAAVFIDIGHTFSPIVMAWAHAGFRQVMLRHPWKFIALPLAILVLAGSIGVATSAGLTTFVWGSYRSKVITWLGDTPDLRNPYPFLVWAYIVWNFYHFGMQNFGVLRLCGWRRWRWPTMLGCIGLTTVGLMHFAPIVAFNHWIVEIGLGAKVMKGWRRWAFLAVVPMFGLVALRWQVPKEILTWLGVGGPIWVGWDIPTWHGRATLIIPWMISLRLGAGMAHFLYSRWVWKLSDPQVRETIGRDMFATKVSPWVLESTKSLRRLARV